MTSKPTTPPSPPTSSPAAAPQRAPGTPSGARSAASGPSFAITQAGTPEDRRFTFGIQGTEKCGKTHFACTMPEPLFVQFDTNRETIDSFGHNMIDLSAYDAATAFRKFEREVLPAIFNRDAETIGHPSTIVIDSYSFLFETMQEAVAVPTTSGGDDNTQGWYKELKAKSNQQLYKLMACSRDFPTDPTRDKYNVVVNYHMKQALKKVGKEFVPDKWEPLVEGASKAKLGSYFGCLFWADIGLKDIPGTNPPEKEPAYFFWTQPPDPRRKAVDCVGGKGDYGKLPKQVENTWPAICKGWGINPDTAARNG